MANVVYDGQRLLVPFEGTGGGDFENGIFEFVWFFPQGPVTILEYSEPTHIAGPVGRFDSTIDVTGGGTGDWIWSGSANQAGAKAVIKSISGTLCIDPG